MSSALRETLIIDPLTVTVSSLSCVVVVVLVLLLLLLLYRRNQSCCNTDGSRHTNAPRQYHSRDALVDVALHDDCTVDRDAFVHNQPPRGPFVIGKPSDYHLPAAAPRLPSYESVRRKDRRTLVHSMISERFGLRSSADCDWEPPPPSYAESLHQPLDVPSLGLRGLDDEEAFPGRRDQEGHSANTDRSATSDHPGAQCLTGQGRDV